MLERVAGFLWGSFLIDQALNIFGKEFMGPPYHNTKAAHDSWSLVMLLTEMVHYVMAFHSVVLS